MIIYYIYYIYDIYVYVPVRPSKYCCLDTSSQNAIGHHVWLSTVFSFAVWLLLSHRIYLLFMLQIITIKRATCLDHFKYLSLMRIRDVWKVVLACTRKAAVESLLKSRTQTPVVQSVPGLPGLRIYDTIWHNAYHDIFLGSVQILSEGPWWTWPGSVPCRPHCRALPRRRRGNRKAWTTRRTLSGRRCCSWNLGRVTLEPSTKKKSCWKHHYTIPIHSLEAFTSLWFIHFPFSPVWHAALPGCSGYPNTDASSVMIRRSSQAANQRSKKLTARGVLRSKMKPVAILGFHVAPYNHVEIYCFNMISKRPWAFCSHHAGGVRNGL